MVRVGDVITDPEKGNALARQVLARQQFVRRHLNLSEITGKLSSHLVKQVPRIGPYSTHPKVSIAERTSFKQDTYFLFSTAGGAHRSSRL